MSNFAHDIEEEAGAEPIIGIVVGGPRRYWVDEGDHGLAGVVTWEQARPVLDYTYDPGHGGEDCHPIRAWTATRVLFVACYDGATWVASVPRNPTDGTPEFVGGG